MYIYQHRFRYKAIFNPPPRYINMKRVLIISLVVLATVHVASAQRRTVQNRPYTDLRPFHFGILVGPHAQDIELTNVGPQIIINDDGSQSEHTITADQDRWDLGFHVGVLGEFRLSDDFQLRVAPTLYFGNRHIVFQNMHPRAIDTLTEHRQNLKTVYAGCATDIIFGAKRCNNHRPYIMAGLNPIINLTNSKNDYIALKRYDLFLEAGVGCDFYLPFFKLRPEIKFMYGLTNALDPNYPSRIKDKNMLPYAKAVNKAQCKMFVLTFYFE